jgi:hypothetical protein
MTRFHLKSVALAVLALGAFSAQADTVTLPDFAFSSESVTVNVTGVTAGTVADSAGAFKTSVNGGASFLSYCIDLTQSAQLYGSDSSYTRVAGGSYSFANPNAAFEQTVHFCRFVGQQRAHIGSVPIGRLGNHLRGSSQHVLNGHGSRRLRPRAKQCRHHHVG